MKREATEKAIAKRAAHEIRAAAVRQAREWAGQDTDPSLAYGCVDWFRYDVAPAPREAHTAPLLPPAVRPGAGRGAPPPVH